jgi:hypothetical protein
MAITGGYRGRIPGTAAGAFPVERDGLYISASYSHLYGIHYDNVDLSVRFDTDSQGLVTLSPTTTPLVIDRTTSRKGSGLSIDLGSAYVMGPWDFRFAVNGVANRIDWDELSAQRITLNSIFAGGDFVDTPLPAPVGKRRISLPQQYVGGAGYNGMRWAAATELSHGVEDTELRGGVEYRTRFVELRGGGRYSRDLWHPSGGAGLNITRGFGVDVGFFTTASNIEGERRGAMAVSLRIGGAIGDQ